MTVPYDEPMSAARRQNMQLLYDPSEDDDYLLPSQRRNQPSPPPASQRRLLAPLIEEEPSEAGSAIGDSAGKANLARQIYDRNQAAKNPWKRGMPFSQSVLDMFDTSTAYDKQLYGGIRNPRQAANLAANRPAGFQKLFGAKLSKNERFKRDVERGAPKKTLWQRLKHAVTGGGRKRSWMEMFFGARRRGEGNTPRAMGISSRKAPMGVSSGWADQLIDASKAGTLGDGREGGGMGSERLPSAPAQEQPRSVEYLDEAPQPAPMATKLISNVPARKPHISEPAQENEYFGAGQQQDDDESIDQDDPAEDAEAEEASRQRMLMYMNLFDNKDDDN